MSEREMGKPDIYPCIHEWDLELLAYRCRHCGAETTARSSTSTTDAVVRTQCATCAAAGRRQ